METAAGVGSLSDSRLPFQGVIKRESVTVELIEEMMPLFESHYEEVGQNDSFEPDFKAYFEADKRDRLRALTLRVSGELVGYAIFAVSKCLHAINETEAFCQLLYVSGAHRAQMGFEFMKRCREAMRSEGHTWIKFVTTPKRDFSVLLKRMGLHEEETVYSGRLA